MSTFAAVAELADALDLGSSGRKPVEVRVLSAASQFEPRKLHRLGLPMTIGVQVVDRGMSKHLGWVARRPVAVWRTLSYDSGASRYRL